MFTTSRYASPTAREMARRISAEAGEPFLSRGKHTIDQLAWIARRKGERHIFIVEESKVMSIEVDETGKWRWVDQ